MRKIISTKPLWCGFEANYVPKLTRIVDNLGVVQSLRRLFVAFTDFYTLQSFPRTLLSIVLFYIDSKFGAVLNRIT